MFVAGIMDCQDWETVKIRKRAPKPKPAPAHIAGSKTLRILDEDDMPVKPTRSLSKESRDEIIRLRNAHEPKWSQADLNTACSFPLHTIRDIEFGILCPNPTQLTVLNRVLRTTLKYSSK